MAKICKQCGAINSEHDLRCCFCDTLLATYLEIAAAHTRAAPTEGNLAVAPDWRREVAHRLKAYRDRRQHLPMDDSQTALPFEGSAAEPDARAAGASLLEPCHKPGSFEPTDQDCALPIRVEPVEITIMQPELQFPDTDSPSGAWVRRGTTSDSPLVPVAALGERKLAGLFDGGFVLLAYASFMALFASLGGQFSFGKSEALVYAATFVLFYAQYFALFTVFGRATPGMLLRGLRVVSFDGTPATHGQLLWRSFGYIVSGGTALLGFFWALWDEDHLTWHDRISQTYITPDLRTAESESLSSSAQT